MKNRKSTNNLNTFINNSELKENSQEIDLKEISENIFKLTEKKYGENNIDINIKTIKYEFKNY